MSADNGVYILRTKKSNGFEYRVAHLQAVENVYRHSCSKHGIDYYFRKCKECCTGNCKHSTCHIIQARDMWKDCQVFTDEQEALNEASKLLEEYEEDGFPVEYGISFIDIDEKF